MRRIYSWPLLWEAEVIFSDKACRTLARRTLFSILAICVIEVSGSLQNHSAYRSTINQGKILRQQGEFLKAVEMFNQALRLGRANNDANIELECLMNLGFLNWDLGKVKESNELFCQALLLSQKLALKEQEARCSTYLRIYEAYVRGKEACASGSHQESIDQFNMAIDLARKIDSPEHELKCLRQMSMNYYHTKMYEQFSSLNNKAFLIARKINHMKEEARCLNNIGISLYETSNYSRALIYYGEALSILGEYVDEGYDLSAILNNIGVTYRDLGGYDKAISSIRRALDIDTNLNDYEGIAAELSNLAATYRRKGILSNNRDDVYLSLALNVESLEAAKRTGNKRSITAALNNIGLAYASDGKYVQALMYFQWALNEANLIGDFSEACNIYANMGFVLMEEENFGKAEEHFRKGLELVLRAGRNEVLWETYFGLGQCLEKREHHDEALVCYEKAINTIDFMRSRLALDDLKAGFIRDKMKAYESLVNLLFIRKGKELTLKYDPEIFEVIEKAKARAFLEELEKTDWRTSKSNVSPLRNEGEDLSRNISLTISELTSPHLEEGQRQKLLNRLEIEEDEYANLLNRIKTEEADSTGIASPQVVSAAEMKEKYLDEKSALLEFFLGENKSFGILISRDNFVLKELPPRTIIEDSLRAYLKLLSTPPKAGFQGIPAARRIYRDLIFPFESAISDGIDHLIIIPDGILHYLPFETLVRDNLITHEARYLLELYDISYAPSGSSLAYLMDKGQRGQYRKTLLAVGDPVYFPAHNTILHSRRRYENVLRDIYLDEGFELPALPQSKKEIERIAHCFPGGKVDVLLEHQANEEGIKNRSLEEYRIIHFACHGFLDEKIPMRSALVLTLDDDPEEDGFLQAREIANLKLNADLVVLSACQTGKGRLENAEGVFGLPRTFFYAGARSTISSLWKINDKATSEIMPEFYRHLAAGDTKVHSLRLAKLTMLKSRFSHPFYWAAFVLNGDYL
jgi:CHAT domain-containing protein/tetratricopeptide (TPR) repeat protein